MAGPAGLGAGAGGDLECSRIAAGALSRRPTPGGASGHPLQIARGEELGGGGGPRQGGRETGGGLETGGVVRGGRC